MKAKNKKSFLRVVQKVNISVPSDMVHSVQHGPTLRACCFHGNHYLRKKILRILKNDYIHVLSTDFLIYCSIKLSIEYQFECQKPRNTISIDSVRHGQFLQSHTKPSNFEGKLYHGMIVGCNTYTHVQLKQLYFWNKNDSQTCYQFCPTWILR